MGMLLSRNLILFFQISENFHIEAYFFSLLQSLHQTLLFTEYSLKNVGMKRIRSSDFQLTNLHSKAIPTDPTFTIK